MLSARGSALVAAVGIVSLTLITPAAARAQAILEGFEGATGTWQVAADTAGSGAVAQTSARAAAGAASARLTTASATATASIRGTFSDPAGSHAWMERPGTYRWQRARVYVPSATVAQLGATGYVTVARFWSSGQSTTGWSLRVRQNGALSVVGTRDWDGARLEFDVAGTLPTDRWVELEVGLHTQAGPGVKRAFAFLVDGQFYGWYHQGRMQGETYDRVAIGLVDTNSGGALEAFVDEWGVAGTGAFPTGTDLRPTTAVQEQDYRARRGVQWQIDWATWANDLRLDPTGGLYSNTDRLQSGRNLDRMPDLTSGWAEIEIGWPKGTPPVAPSSYFGPMVGFRKEINREQNFEVIPIGMGGGKVDLVVEAWDGNGPIIFGRWAMPTASIGGTAIPEAGDVIRARWEQVSATSIDVKASFYDASTASWYTDVISKVINVSAISGIDFNDRFHTASSVTTDTPYYGIRRYKVGALATYPGSDACTFALTPGSQSVAAEGGTGSVAVTAGAGCTWSATANDAWLAVTGGSPGAGGGTVTFSAAANTAASTRTGTLTIAGQTVSVAQAGATSTMPVVSLGDASVTEGHAGAVVASFPVTLSTASPDPVTVSYATGNGTATPGVDYGAASGSVTFAPGETSHVLTVSVIGDTLDEAFETFAVTLSGPGNAALGRSVATGTIVDDDPAPTLSVGAPVTVVEGNAGTATAGIVVSLSAASGQPVTVSYATANGTATAGSDYTAASGTLTFPAGVTTQAITVAVVGDTSVEPNETFTVTLGAATNAAVASGVATVTITNDDTAPPAGTPTIAVTGSSAKESNGSIRFTLTLSAPSAGPVTVRYTTAGGTATSGVDFYALAGTVTFAAGTTSQAVTIWMRDDKQREGTEVFYLDLSSPTGATIAVARGTGTITDND